MTKKVLLNKRYRKQKNHFLTITYEPNEGKTRGKSVEGSYFPH